MALSKAAGHDRRLEGLKRLQIQGGTSGQRWIEAAFEFGREQQAAVALAAFARDLAGPAVTSPPVPAPAAASNGNDSPGDR